ncbi:MAG: hypothetical protein IJ123_05550 [Blautia sp.]|nr:hypothetical protein [Blautia sp.]
MAVKKGRAVPAEKMDPAAVEINRGMVISITVNTAIAVIMLVFGGWYRTDWLIMLAIGLLISGFARSMLFLPARKPGRVKSRILKGYQKYRLSGIILAALYLVMVVFVVLKHKEGFFYPLPVLLATAVLAVYKIAALVYDMRLFMETEGPYTAGLRIMDLGEALFACMLIIQLIAAALSGVFVADGIIWIVTVVFCALLFAASIYMIIFADGEIRYHSV